MILVQKTVSVKVYTWDELTKLQKELFVVAANFRHKAQAPHSHYKVGAAVLMEGKIFGGVNVESCSWTQTTHAEQCGITSGIAKLGPNRISNVTVIGAPETHKVILPPITAPDLRTQNYKVEDFCPSCGHCLQIIIENCFKATGEYDPNVQLWGYNKKGAFYQTTIGDALPMPFPPQHLGVNMAEYKKSQEN